MNRKSCMYSKWVLLLIGIFLFIACDDDNAGMPDPTYPEIPAEELQVQWKLLKEFTFDDLKEAQSGLGIGIKEIEQLLLGKNPHYPNSDIQMRALKVAFKSDHPDGSGDKIDLSGVVLMPPAMDSTTMHPLVIALPYTYVENSDAPSNQLTNYDADNLEAFLIFWMIKASQGYIVVIPDYPGFGDSHGQCFIPYIDSKSMIRTTYDFLQAAQIALNENYYASEKSLIVTGYSLGGFVATSLARKIETNPEDNYTVNLLFVGGAPLRLKQISDLVRASDELETPYLMPYAIWGYKKNSYPDLKVEDILKEPYASESDKYFDGNHSGIGELFPKNVNELFTEKYINDTNSANAFINNILDENSVIPWQNKCRFTMIHGKNDKTVYYENAQEYEREHKAAGGKVSFISITSGTHSSTGITYFINLFLQLR